jgi:hypothetical protein
MGKIEFIKDGLEMARNYTDGLFSQFQSADEWVHQPHPQANHALWCAGHLAATDDFAISLLAPDQVSPREGYKELFGGGSTPVADAAKYPSPAEILDYLKERRAALIGVLAGLSEADLSKPTPDDAPDFMPTVEAVFRIVTWHEGLHAGQASIAHRSLGKAPVMG